MSGGNFHFPRKAGSYTRTTPGATSFVVPNNITQMNLVIWGAGGGGSGGASAGTTSGAGGNGGQLASIMIPVNPGETLSISVGTGGTSGPVNNQGGNGGGTSIVGSFGTIFAPGGLGGGQGPGMTYLRQSENFIHGGGRGGTGREQSGTYNAEEGLPGLYGVGGAHSTYGGGGGGCYGVGGTGGASAGGSPGGNGGLGAGGGGGGPNGVGGVAGNGGVILYWGSNY